MADIRVGEHDLVAAFACLQSCTEGRTKEGRTFMDVKLSDVSGVVGGKIWADTPSALSAARDIGLGAAVKILFEPRAYRGALQLRIVRIRIVSAGDGHSEDALFGAGHRLIADLNFRTMVFDIETVPNTDLRKVPSTIAQAVAKHAQRGDGDDAKIMSLSPLFGKVVSIAMGEGEAIDDPQLPTVLAVPPENSDPTTLPEWIRPMSEPDLLRCFWTLCERTELVVSFNGYGFDVPFLATRSLVHGISVRVDLLSRPFALRPHLDLYRVLTQGSRGLGPASLDVYCWALGFTSPKGEMDGSMVAPTYARGDIETICEYNAGDVAATTAVYRHVREHLLQFRHDW
ncbi:MAG: ribonuclease H-like domain-containing protein [Nannocystaceae bacterium]